MKAKKNRTESVYFSLGSNLGDKKQNIEIAIEKMSELFCSPCVKKSSFYESKSWGFEGEDFINCAVMFELDKEPQEVLDICKGIERGMGREELVEKDESGRRIYHDRIIDIDILLFGSRVIDTEILTIPHPLMEKREFVMIPLNEIR